MDPRQIEVILLGTAQDGGIPHIGCHCPHCHAARTDASRRRLVASIGIIDHKDQAFWIVDASPDIGEQIEPLSLKYPGYRLAGVLLTHAHIGHFLGLAFLGRESLNTRDLSVLCTQRMAAFLSENQPWKQLVDLGNIALTIIEPGSPVLLTSAVTVTPILVPHRDELSDTVAFSIAGPKQRLVYCPDIDRWEGPILKAIREADIALLDGTFYSADELPGRDISKIPHPCITDSIKTFSGYKPEIRFIHLNHSNRLLSDDRLLAELKTRGFDIGRRGDIWGL